MRKSKFRFLPVLGLVLFLILSGLGFWAMQNQNINLDFRRQAAGEQLNVTLGNSSTKIQPGQALTVDLMINTQGKFVSGVEFSGTITGVNQDKSGVVISQIAGLTPVFSEITKVGSDLKFRFIELATIGGSAFTTHDQNQKLATFNLYPLQSGEVKLTFDQNKSGAMEFGKTFLPTNLQQQKYSVEVTTATGGTSNAPADGGIHRSCNEYCADSRECNTAYSCWYNRCRNPKNLTEEKCTDPVVIKPSPVTTVVNTNTTPKGGTPTPTPAAKTTVATVIITTASSSTKVASVSSTPIPTPKISSTNQGNIVKNVVTSPSPTLSPTPVALANTSQGSSNIGFLIGAAIGTGILAFVALVFFLKNRNA